MRRWLCWWLLGGSLAAQGLALSVHGRVVDENGAPLLGVAVCAFVDGSLFTTAELARAPLTTTAADGTFTALLPAAGDAARPDGLLFVARGRMHVATALQQHDGWPVVLPRAQTLAGRVHDADGNPVAGVRVEARDWLPAARYCWCEEVRRPDWLPQPRTAVRTDERGHFAIPGTGDAGILLVVGGDRCFEVALGPFAIGDPIDIVVKPEPPVAVLVVGPDGKPVADAEVRWRRNCTSRTDARGRATSTALPLGAVTASATIDGVRHTGGVKLRDRAVVRIDLRPVAAGAPVALVRVRAVAADGTAIASFRAAVLCTHDQVGKRVDDLRRFAQIAVDAVDGLASVPLTDNGGDDRVVYALAPGRALARMRLEPDAVEATVHFEPEATIAGTVVDAAGAPVVGARVWTAEGIDDNYLKIEWGTAAFAVTRHDPHWGHAITGADGSFKIANIATGKQHVFCTAAGFASPVPVAVEPVAGTMVTGLRVALARLRGFAGTTGLTRALPFGASVRFRMLRGDHWNSAEENDYGSSFPLGTGGTFHVADLPPGRYMAQLVVPRMLRQGPPDKIDVEDVEVTEQTESLAIAAPAVQPAIVRGTVKGAAPAGRLLVLSGEKCNGNVFYGYANYLGPLATVGPDGSFMLRTPPGERTFAVIDLLTGSLLHREPPREVKPGEDLSLDLQVDVSAVDVRLRGLDPQQQGWLEVRAPREWWPGGIDRMNFTVHEYTQRMGCRLAPGTKELRLWLPPATFDLWLVQGDENKVRGRRGEATIDVVAGRTQTVDVELPKD